MSRACSANAAKENAYRILMGKPKVKTLLGRPRRMWVNNIKMYLRGIRWYGVDLVGVAQYRDRWRALVNTVLNLRVP
jgi:hypothetical protein